MNPYKFKTVRLVISQPRIDNHPKEWALPVSDLLAFGSTALQKGRTALLLKDISDKSPVNPDTDLTPSEDGCRFCKASATCPAFRKEVAKILGMGTRSTDDVEFEDLDTVQPTADTTADALGKAMAKVPMVEIWCKAVRAETEKRLLAGEPVAGFKLVQGRRGSRRWSNAAEVRELMKKFRCKPEEMFKFELISPTEAEKRMAEWLDDDGMVHEPILGPRQYGKLKEMVTQSEGSPSVAPESDKRPALVVGAQADDFVDETGSDLL